MIEQTAAATNFKKNKIPNKHHRPTTGKNWKQIRPLVLWAEG